DGGQIRGQEWAVASTPGPESRAQRPGPVARDRRARGVVRQRGHDPQVRTAWAKRGMPGAEQDGGAPDHRHDRGRVGSVRILRSAGTAAKPAYPVVELSRDSLPAYTAIAPAIAPAIARQLCPGGADST